MNGQSRVFAHSLLARSALFGVILGVGVFVLGMGLDLWHRGPGSYVALMIFVGSIVLLPIYEKFAGLGPLASEPDVAKPAAN